MNEQALRQYATDRQAQILDAYLQHKTLGKTAKALDVGKSTVQSALDQLKRKAEKNGHNPTQKERKHFVIPDVQAKHGNDFAYLRATGNYIVEKRPDVVVCIGDFADMESLSTYDRGLKSFEGRSYQRDIWAAREAMDALLEPLFALRKQQEANGEELYQPRMVLTLGNHEHRINRAVNEDRKLDGLISVEDLPYQDWEVIPFLQVVAIDGIAYSHYFTSGVMGRPITTAQALLTKKHMSCFAGHQQGRQIAYGRRADGKEMTAIICGSFYEHDEDYLGVQGNLHFRGCYMLHETDDGAFDEMAISIKYLKVNYL
jgi:hypothetical protein